MFTPFERLLAWRYLRSKRKEGFVSVITGFSLSGIALGVAALIVITSVMNGVKTEMLKHFIGLSGHITIYSASGAIADYPPLLQQIQHNEGIKDVTPAIEGQVMVSANGRASGAQVLALRPENLAKKPEIIQKITAGSLENFTSGEGVMLGERLAENLGLRIGDSVTLISPEGRQTIAGLVPRLKSYPLVATFKLGMNTFDAGLVIMPFAEAGIYFKLTDGGSDKISVINANVLDANQAMPIAHRLQQQLGDNFRVYDWQQSNKSVFEALTVQRNVMFIILTLIIIVAAFNIISSLIMLVKDKSRDIAILRTMGASRRSITKIFFASGALIGIAGTFIGVVAGLIIAVNVDNIRVWVEHISGGKILAEQLYFLSSLPAEIDSGQVLAVVLMSLSLSFLATLYPARRAASLDPAQGLRYE